MHFLIRVFCSSALAFSLVANGAGGCDEEVGGQSGGHEHSFAAEGEKPSPEVVAFWRKFLDDASAPLRDRVWGLAALVNGVGLTRGAYPGHKIYSETVLFLAAKDHAVHIPGRVMVYLPGGLRGNSDPAWNAVRAVTKEICSCGNERVLFGPEGALAEFVDQTPPVEVTITADKPLYLRPEGGDLSTTWVRFELETHGGVTSLTTAFDPFGPVNMGAMLDLLSGPKGWSLDDLAQLLPGQPGPVPFKMNHDVGGNRTIFPLALTGADFAAKTVTARVPKGVHAFHDEKAQ